MPQSKHRRKGKQRPRAHQTVEPPRNPVPSPPWVAATGVGLLIAGIVVILLGYLVLNEVTGNWPIFGANWGLVSGFVLLIVGFVFLTRWR